jgi:hypothetical protein
VLFKVFGPYRLPRDDAKHVAATAQDRSKFWSAVAEIEPGLPDACGCYVFSLKGRKRVEALVRRQGRAKYVSNRITISPQAKPLQRHHCAAQGHPRTISARSNHAIRGV